MCVCGGGGGGGGGVFDWCTGGNMYFYLEITVSLLDERCYYIRYSVGGEKILCLRLVNI